MKSLPQFFASYLAAEADAGLGTQVLEQRIAVPLHLYSVPFAVFFFPLFLVKVRPFSSTPILRSEQLFPCSPVYLSLPENLRKSVPELRFIDANATLV